MSRAFNLQTLEAFAAAQTGEIFLELLELSDDSANPPIRVVNNTQAVVHQGETYTAAAFGMNLAGEAVDEVERVRLRVENVDRLLVDLVRSAQGVPTATIRIVRADDLDVSLLTAKFEIESATIDEQVIEGQLIYDNAINSKFPRDKVTPYSYPAGPFQ